MTRGALRTEGDLPVQPVFIDFRRAVAVQQEQGVVSCDKIADTRRQLDDDIGPSRLGHQRLQIYRDHDRGSGTMREHRAAHWMRRALTVEPGAAWINRTLAVTYDRLGERSAAMQSLEALRRYRPDIRIRDVVSAMHFPTDFVSRVANGLSYLGLPP